MIKVGVITLHAIKNYGSVLQAYATQEILHNIGFDVTIIDYVREDARKENILNSCSNGNWLKKIVLMPSVKRWEQVFDKFNDQYLNLTEETYTSEEDFNNASFDYDAYCTGSDQVWNSISNRGIRTPLYLSFASESKYKFSFASSFGQMTLPDLEVAELKCLIHQYNYISVREDTGKDILINQFGYKKVEHVLDPTLAVPPIFWRNLKAKSKLKEDYILVYNLNNNKDFDIFATEIAKKAGLKLVRLCVRYDQFYKPGKSIFLPEVPVFIDLIDKAKYVLTDSFHATAFSMSLNTKPICVMPPKFQSRIQSILSLLDAEKSCLARDYTDYDILNRKIDFEKINNILDSERKKTINYLKKVYEDADKLVKNGE